MLSSWQRTTQRTTQPHVSRTARGNAHMGMPGRIPQNTAQNSTARPVRRTPACASNALCRGVLLFCGPSTCVIVYTHRNSKPRTLGLGGPSRALQYFRGPLMNPSIGVSQSGTITPACQNRGVSKPTSRSQRENDQANATVKTLQPCCGKTAVPAQKPVKPRKIRVSAVSANSDTVPES